MRYLILNILFVLFPLLIPAQVTFIVNQLPENTPENASIYISGNFEGWAGGQEKYRLQKKEGTYRITIPKISKNIQYKFTLGSWKKVEVNKNGNDIENRNYTFKEHPETLKITIEKWNDPKQKTSTASKNVSVLSEDFYMPQLNRKRKIRIYLPPGYNNSGKRYPVIYMHDGQNLFDRATSFSGEWEVDESLNEIFNETGKGFIVIGIDNGGKKRLDEYSPWKNKKYGGGEGAAYTEFVVKTLKPYVDKHYRTFPEKELTAVFGSSMGGLISFYAGLKYPNVFGKTGAFSPSFWFSDQSFKFAKTHGNLKNSRIYLLAGNKEGDNTAFDEISQTVVDMNKIIDLLKESGFNKENIHSKVVPEGRHNEKLWKENFKEAIQWLFEK